MTPLLPEEVCWILDRALAAEVRIVLLLHLFSVTKPGAQFTKQMEWHSGNMLAHTVFTLTYIYHLDVMDADYNMLDYLSEEDPQRPAELIIGVLGPYIQGLLKCIDLAWRELHGNELIHEVGSIYS